MQYGPVFELLAHTANHQGQAWRIAVAIGGVVAMVPLLVSRGARADLRRWVLCYLGGLFGAVTGATLLPMVLRLPAALNTFDFHSIFVGDRMAIGALVGFALVAAWVAGRVGLERWRALDRLAPSMGALVIFGRIGCFLEGCDFGAITGVPWGVAYPAGSHAFEHQVARGLVRASDIRSLPVHPAQLYEVVVGAGMIVAAWWIGRRAAREWSGHGWGFRTAIGVYAVGRIVVETFRGDARGALGPLSLPQCLCIALLAWCAAGLFGERDPRKVSAAPPGG